MEAEWEEGTDCENKPDHVSKSAARETSMEGKKVWAGKRSAGRGETDVEGKRTLLEVERDRREGRSFVEIQRERMESVYERRNAVHE